MYQNDPRAKLISEDNVVPFVIGFLMVEGQKEIDGDGDHSATRSRDKSLKLATLLSVLFLAWDVTQLPQSRASSFVSFLLDLLDTKTTTTIRSDNGDHLHHSFLFSFEYVPQRCVLIIQMQILTLLYLMEVKYGSIAEMIREEEDDISEPVEERRGVKRRHSDPITKLILKSPHSIVLQNALRLMSLLPSELNSRGEDDGIEDETDSLEIWARATRLIQHPSLEVSTDAISYLRSRLLNEGLVSCPYTKQMFFRVFIKERGYLLLNRILQSINTTNSSRVQEVVLLLEAMVKKPETEEEQLVIDIIRRESSSCGLTKTLRLLWNVCNEVEAIAAPLHMTLLNLGEPVESFVNE